MSDFETHPVGTADRIKAMVEALTAMREVVPGAMVSLMLLGRDGLLLADRLHKADDKARAALDQIKGA
jgi:hypothetical protein